MIKNINIQDNGQLNIRKISVLDYHWLIGKQIHITARVVQEVWLNYTKITRWQPAKNSKRPQLAKRSEVSI